MKKILLFIILVSAYGTAFSQQELFMQMLENKKVCNKEDELTYFLQTHSFERNIKDQYVHSYAVGRRFYTTTIINNNECYITYQTNNEKDYNNIKSKIISTSSKELSADKTISYIHSSGRIQDVQIIFAGYSQLEKIYEILVYQNPDKHELPYNQSNRIKKPKISNH